MKIEIETSVFGADIWQEMNICNLETGIRENIMRQVINTKDEQVRQALIQLGWTPPSTPGHYTSKKECRHTELMDAVKDG